MLLRLASMATNGNLLGLLFYFWMSEPIRDILRGTCLLVLASIMTIWCIADMPRVYVELCDSFVTLNGLPEYITKNIKDEETRHTIFVLFYYGIPMVKQVIVFVCDILLHVVPVLLIGLPHTASSVAIAYAILSAWYLLVRHRIHEIYAPSVPADKAFIGAGIMATATVFGLLFSL